MSADQPVSVTAPNRIPPERRLTTSRVAYTKPTRAWANPSPVARRRGSVEKPTSESRNSRTLRRSVHFDRPDSRDCFVYPTDVCRKPSETTRAKIDTLCCGIASRPPSTRRSRKEEVGPGGRQPNRGQAVHQRIVQPRAQARGQRLVLAALAHRPHDLGTAAPRFEQLARRLRWILPVGSQHDEGLSGGGPQTAQDGHVAAAVSRQAQAPDARVTRGPLANDGERLVGAVVVDHDDLQLVRKVRLAEQPRKQHVEVVCLPRMPEARSSGVKAGGDGTQSWARPTSTSAQLHGAPAVAIDSVAASRIAPRAGRPGRP